MAMDAPLPNDDKSSMNKIAVSKQQNYFIFLSILANFLNCNFFCQKVEGIKNTGPKDRCNN